MSPWINIVLIVPALIITGTILLIRVKGKLENKVFLYRHEGIILQTSLTLFRIRNHSGVRRMSLGLALLTAERLIVFDWKQKAVFECEFQSSTHGEEKNCKLHPNPKKNHIAVHCTCGNLDREITMSVRNADAWRLEFSRLCSYESSE